jgi:flagellar basal-body rod modification protein FlgD
MAIDSVTSATSASAVGRTRLAENFDTFLSLLTTQLKNQDPLSPLDSNQFTQQLVQMTGVEQQLLTNDLLEKLVSNTGTGVATAVSLIGKDVRAQTSQAALVDGKAEWTYNLSRDAADVKLEILDSKGRVVRSIAPTNNKAGDHTLNWDGKADGGSTVPDGVYTLRATALDSQKSTVPGTIFVKGVVTGVEQVDGLTVLSIRGVKVPWEQITSISQPVEVAATPPPTPPTGSNNDNDSNNNPDDEETPSQAAA